MNWLARVKERPGREMVFLHKKSPRRVNGDSGKGFEEKLIFFNKPFVNQPTTS